ncbi:MAG: TetR family transcriptional regulator C-terminal domain-containing protein [Phascolarctobacterium sp.]|nr:TetR family transcriptional regulator C-terminal domain-containing protein [Phascolarctobacterium sp.]
MCDYLFRHIFETSSETGEHDFSNMPQTPEAMVTHILYHLRDRKKDFLPILAGENGDLLRYFSRTYRARLAEFYLPCRDLPETALPPEDFILNYLSFSFTGMLRWWIKNKLRQSPEQLAKYFTAVTGLVANKKAP